LIERQTLYKHLEEVLEINDVQENGIFFIAGVVIGGLLGAITALLFAPRAGRGRETIEVIGERGRALKGRAEEAAARALRASGELGEEVQQAVDRMHLATQEELGKLQETVAGLEKKLASK
jgi:gas vesicle protein